MFRLEHPYYLFLIILVIVLGLLQLWGRNRMMQELNRLASKSLWKSILPDFDEKKLNKRTWLWIVGLFLIVLSLANPQWGIRKEKIEIKSTDIYLVIDISNSMLSDDVKPNRLERAKLWAESFIRQMSNDRIGTVLFAGHAFLQAPLTTDYGSATMFIRAAHPELITAQGTNISDAIAICLENFSKNNEAQKVIILMSDGEDHDELANDIATKAVAQQVSIFSIGTGTKTGGLIPVQSKGMEDYKRDETGKPVRTALNEDILEKIAKNSKGAYYHIGQGEAIIPDLKSEIANRTKQKVAERAYADYESYFQYLLFPGILLLLIEYLYQFNWFERFKRKIK